MMHGMKKSDEAVLPVKAANKGAQTPAESPEGRASTKGNLRDQSTHRTQGRDGVSQAVERIRQAATRKPQEKLTALLHHITTDALRCAFFDLKKTASAGVDGMVWSEYEAGLDERLLDLHDRVHSGAYRALPSRRVEIPKPDGGTRPLGIAALEDKIVQKAVVDVILTPIYEPEFLGFSYGFRPGRGAHDALDALAFGIERRKVNWIIDADIRAFFDRLSRDHLLRFLEHRIGDPRVLRLITKWLNAGVMEDDEWKDDLQGTPQGAVVSPILANVYLHYVLDLWFQQKWRARKATGDTIIVRYADDFVVGCQRKADAEQFLRDLKERLGDFALDLHPDKTRLIEFGRFALVDRRARGERRPETFDFLGFTHYCKKQRNGQFGLGRKPIAKRVTRTLKRVKEKLRERMHEDVHDTAQWLGRVVNGWLNYYAVPTSARALRGFARRLLWIWLRTLRGRSQKDRTTIAGVARLAALYWPPVKVRHPWPTERFAVSHPR
jgi:group II intron reverse transcriptase/maturase